MASYGPWHGASVRAGYIPIYIAPVTPVDLFSFLFFGTFIRLVVTYVTKKFEMELKNFVFTFRIIRDNAR